MRQIVKIIKLVAVLCIFLASVVPSNAQEEFSESIDADTVVQSAPEEAQESVESVVEPAAETIEEVSTEIESTHEEENQVVESEQNIEVTDETIDPVLKVSKVIDDNTLYIEGVANPGVLVQILKQNQVIGSDYATSNGGFEVELKESIQAGTNLVIESVEDGGTIATLNETVRETGIYLSHPLYETSKDLVGITSSEQRVEVLDNQNSVIASGISDVNGQFTVSLSEPAEIGSQVSIRVYDRDRIARVEVLNVELDPSIVIDKPDIPSEINTETLYIQGNAQTNLDIQLMDADSHLIDTVKSGEDGRFSFELDAGLESGSEVQFVATDGWRTSESVQILVKDVEVIEDDAIVAEDIPLEEVTPEETVDQLFEGLFDGEKPLEEQVDGLDEEQLHLLIEKINLNREAFDRLLKENTQGLQYSEPETANDVIMSLVEQLIGFQKEDELFDLADFLLSKESLLSGLEDEAFKEKIAETLVDSSLKNDSEDDLFIQLDHEVYEDTTELVGKTVPGALVSLIDAEGNVIDTVTSDETGVFRMVLDEGFGVGETIQIQVRLGLKSSSMKIEIKQQLETIEPMMINLSSMQTFSAGISQNGFISVEPVYDTSENININININKSNKGFFYYLLELLIRPFYKIENTTYQVYLEENGNRHPIANKRIYSSEDEFIKEINENKSEFNLDRLQAGDQFKVIVTLEYVERYLLGISHKEVEEKIDELTVVVQGNQFGFSSNPPTYITFESTQITNEPNKVIPRVDNIPISLSIIDTRENGQWNLMVSSTRMTHTTSGHQLKNVLYFKDGMNGLEHPIDEGDPVSVDEKSSGDSTHEKSKNWNQGEGIILKMNPIHAMPGEYTSTITWTLTDGP